MTEHAAAPQERDLDWEEPSARTGYTRVPNWVVDYPGLSVYAKAVYLVIARHINNQSSDAWPGIDRIATRVGCSVRQVRNAQNELRDAGLLRSRRRGLGMTNIYRLRFTEPSDRHREPNRSASGAEQDRCSVPTNKTEENKTKKNKQQQTAASARARESDQTRRARDRARAMLDFMLERAMIGEGSDEAAHAALDVAFADHGTETVLMALSHVTAWASDTMNPLRDRRLSVQLPAAIRKVQGEDPKTKTGADERWAS